MGDTEDVKRRARNALEEIDAGHLLTTTEAASMLGIRSVNTLKLLCKRGDVGYVIRAIDKAFDEIKALGSNEPMTEEEMEILHQSRPGVLSWEREQGKSDDEMRS